MKYSITFVPLTILVLSNGVELTTYVPRFCVEFIAHHSDFFIESIGEPFTIYNLDPPYIYRGLDSTLSDDFFDKVCRLAYE